MSHFISHIDEANQRVNALEAQLGLALSPFIDNTDNANARIRELEGKLGGAATAAQEAEELRKLNARCRQLCECLGFKSYGDFTTVAAAKERITQLESTLQQRTQAHEEKEKPKATEPKPLPNGLAAIEKSGKVFGLGKAMIAAQRAHQQKEESK